VRHGQEPAVHRLVGSPQIDGLAYAPDGKLLAVASRGGPLLLYNVEPFELVRAIAESSDVHTDCAFSGDGRYLAVACVADGGVKVYDVAQGSTWARLPGQGCVAFSPDNRFVASESPQDREYFPVELWDLVQGRSAGRMNGHKAPLHSIAFSPDARLLATGGEDGTAIIWDVAARAARHVLRGHVHAIYRVAFAGNANRLATAGRDGTVRFWDTRSGRVVLSIDVGRNIRSMAFSADGSIMATASDEGPGWRVHLWTAPTRASSHSTAADQLLLQTLATGPG
jgi:hypothetical protein